jgi:hypothetical protein
MRWFITRILSIYGAAIFIAWGLGGCSDQSFSGASKAPHKIVKPAETTTAIDPVPEVTHDNGTVDAPQVSTTPAAPPPTTAIVNENASVPQNITGMYLISCLTSIVSEMEATVLCTLRDAVMVRNAPEGEIVWGFEHPAKDQVLSKVTITPTPGHAMQDVIYRLKESNAASLADLITSLKVTASAAAGFVEGKAYRPCGDAGNSCYNDKDSMNAGFVATVSKKALVTVALASGQKIWKEFGGNRLLKASGSDEWQMQLNADGNSFAATPYTNIQGLAGRVCPPNVYLNAANRFANDSCLYYDAGNAAQPLHAAGVSQTDINQMGLQSWQNYNGGAAKWYVGNIRTCAVKGMRLPALYETTSCNSIDKQYLPLADGTPVFALAAGVPEVPGAEYTWSASTAMAGADNYFSYGLNKWAGYIYSYSYAVRCVLP